MVLQEPEEQFEEQMEESGQEEPRSDKPVVNVDKPSDEQAESVIPDEAPSGELDQEDILSSNEQDKPVIPATIPPEVPAEGQAAWYVIHCYSGYENKVRHNLEQRIETMHER